MENEIIVFYFTGHSHFAEESYIERAQAFLLELFQIKSVIWNSIRAGSFREKTSRTITWQYDRAKGYFTNRPPKNFALDAVEVILVGEDCYIEIFKRCNAYIWAPAGNIIRSGFYDTKEKAILSAKDALNGRM